MTEENKMIFRKAEANDIPTVREMIQELADFEKMSNGPQLTDEDLIRDSGLNGGTQHCHIYVLDLQKGTSIATIGYAICYFSYSTWLGKSYFLEDIYVKPNYRRIGAGTRIFREVAKKAQEFNCKRLDFHVLAWNPACKFYEKMGALDLTKSEEWHYYRVSEDSLAKLSSEVQH